ncbi:MAG: hypothetical protein JSS22_03870, partial [Proteobacteria bacterium]|nr:hypothetical protein [Pseudomonadota bacterium]
MTNTHLLQRLAWASGVAMLLSFVATPGQAADKPILIGATSSETGPFAADAEYNLNCMKLAVEDANA